MTDQPFRDVAAFAALSRLTGLTLSPRGDRLVATMQQLDAKRARYRPALWQLPLDDSTPPQQLTRSDKGETAPAFLPGGELLFTSGRPAPDADDDADGDGEEDEPALWLLPPSGEARLLARRAGGLGDAVVAVEAGTVVAAGSTLLHSGSESGSNDDAQRRKQRKDRKVSAILHTGMPIRYWDHELGDESTRLVRVDVASGQLRDLIPDAGFALTEASYSISADGRTLAATWAQRRRGGDAPQGVALLDLDSGRLQVLLDAPAGQEYADPKISPDGRQLAVQHETLGTFDIPRTHRVEIHPVEGGAPVVPDLRDLHPTELAWSRDSRTLYVAGDWHGRAPVLAVDARTGNVQRRLASDAAYSSLCPSPDGRYLYALRSAIDAPPAPVRLDTTGTDQRPDYLANPASVPELPGRLEEVSVELPDGGAHRGWLCLPKPDSSGGPAPLLVFVHGGPFLSTHSWSWRWNPWVAVARRYAVLLPDPALSTGYGPDWIARAWPHRAAVVWSDIEALLEHVVGRPDIDAERTACLGGSFGGFMTNWIAGHTDRFRAIVTHAGLWALDQQHTTTDGAFWKSSLFGTPADHPEWYAQNSPHYFAGTITTPMLVVHGNRDYRVPISEALRLWWDLVSRWQGEPDELPHRFLQLTDENHWVLSPANIEIWYDTVLGFCDQHLRGQQVQPFPLL